MQNQCRTKASRHGCKGIPTKIPYSLLLVFWKIECPVPPPSPHLPSTSSCSFSDLSKFLPFPYPIYIKFINSALSIPIRLVWKHPILHQSSLTSPSPNIFRPSPRISTQGHDTFSIRASNLIAGSHFHSFFLT